jgi:hypothetical protein
VGLCEGVVGVSNLGCNSTKFYLFIEIGSAQFFHKLLCFGFCSCWFCFERLGCTLEKLLKSNIIENLIYITFVQIHHLLKIENQHIHNLQKLKVQLADIFPCKKRKKKTLLIFIG